MTRRLFKEPRSGGKALLRESGEKSRCRRGRGGERDGIRHAAGNDECRGAVFLFAPHEVVQVVQVVQSNGSTIF